MGAWDHGGGLSPPAHGPPLFEMPVARRGEFDPQVQLAAGKKSLLHYRL
jgi:hypothetical protein